ncbi:MAG: helix-turn-helix domain-containing protein [Candidatus Aminicenantes bacterium]|nr:MAG: helix-turn-helix domain-containing protein [Candidatus Aminicenantes bacterium]
MPRYAICAKRREPRTRSLPRSSRPAPGRGCRRIRGRGGRVVGRFVRAVERRASGCGHRISRGRSVRALPRALVAAAPYGRAFQENLGISPQAYFTLRRLDLLQRALIEANPENSSVTDIAMQYGFHELGRFASVYRRQFGELPSETLRMTRCMITTRVSPIRSCDMPTSKPSYLKSFSRHALVGC